MFTSFANKLTLNANNKAYVNITQNEMMNSCHSSVGKIGYSQPLEIGGCRKWWMILHEFAHALGIFFSISQHMYYSDLLNEAYRATGRVILEECVS